MPPFEQHQDQRLSIADEGLAEETDVMGIAPSDIGYFDVKVIKEYYDRERRTRREEEEYLNTIYKEVPITFSRE